jgi:CRISPR-associated protein Csb2
VTLVLEIEHLLGVAFAARVPANDVPDWPPQPDRVFSALVAAWAARGERAEERRALEWLETQPAPEIAASGGSPRSTPVVFVPPNDPETRKVADRMVMPDLRRRQPRRFPAYRPDDPIVSLVWRDTMPEKDTLTALNALAADTPYIGHSASLTRCRFYEDAMLVEREPSRRRVYRGRLAELERQFHAGRRPSPGDAIRAASVETAPERTSFFDNRWLVLEHADGAMPDLRAASLIAKALRNAVMAGYDRIGLSHAIPAEVSGHTADGKPTNEPHLAIAPMAFVGSRYASGAVLGFALIPPRHRNLLADEEFQRALREILPWTEAPERRELKLDGYGLHVTFTIAGAAERRSLDPAPYIAEAAVWASCTPLVLDRHLKESGNAAREAEVEQLIRQSCINIGLPEPNQIVAGKHSAIEGSASAYPSARSPRWMRWRVPETLASRQLTHAVVEFSEPVHGPIILGAGRFVGLGLCRPLHTTGVRDAWHSR